MDHYLTTNQARWNELVGVNSRSAFYDLAGFRAGRCSLMSIEREELGDVRGKSLLHLQCHFGMDTLSWARRGARVTGIDFAPAAVELARTLNAELGLDARFLQTNIYDLPELLDEQFDVVYTFYGALCWLPDLPQWARIVSRFLRPGGIFYVVEGHPMATTLDDRREDAELRVAYPYLPGPEPLRWDEDGSYADRDARLEHRVIYEWLHPLSEVVTSLIEAGLRLRFLHEFPVCAWQQLPAMTRGEDGYWRMPADTPPLPFTFSLMAEQPERATR